MIKNEVIINRDETTKKCIDFDWTIQNEHVKDALVALTVSD